MRASFLLVLGGLLAAAPPALAQTSYPMLMDIRPVAAQVGQTTEHTINARYDLADALQVLVSGQGVTGEIVPPAKPDPAKPDATKPEAKKPQTSLKVKFTVAADALPGVRDVRVVTATGPSTVAQLVLARDPVAAEAPKNDTFEQAQSVTLPATICGAIEKNEDVDFYKFKVEAGKTYTFHVRSARLEDRIHDLQEHSDPIITLKNSAGVDLGQVDNFFFADPLLSHKFADAGEYYLEVRDVRYLGNQYWQYSIEINDRPFVTNVHPLQATPGQETKLELVGANLPAEGQALLKLPADAAPGVRWVSLPHAAGALNPVPVLVSSLPALIEAGDAGPDAEHAQGVTLPACISGRVGVEADVDCYVFEAKKGDRWTFEVVGRRHQSSLDSIVRLLDAKGKQLQENDDLRAGRHTFGDSLIENWTVPADGRYVLEIRDLLLRGGPGYVYAIQATRAEPQFILQTDSDKTLVPPGAAGVIFVKAFRKHGFQDGIQLAIDGLPAGVTATCGRILPGRDDGAIILSAAAGTPPAAGNVTITGTALPAVVPAAAVPAAGEKAGEKPAGDKPADKPAEPAPPAAPLAAIAESMQEIYMPGGGRSHFPVEMHTVAVTRPLDLLRVTIEPAEITLKPGESQKIVVTFERAAGFNANVSLDVLYRHLGSMFGDVLPKGVTIDAKNSKTLVTGKEVQGHITLIAAKDAQPAERQMTPVMAHVAINFVMKLSYVAPPLYVTVTPAEQKTAQR